MQGVDGLQWILAGAAETSQLQGVLKAAEPVVMTAAPERFESYLGGRKVHQEQSHSLPGELRGIVSGKDMAVAVISIENNV